jgi:hypothetical protein
MRERIGLDGIAIGQNDDQRGSRIAGNPRQAPRDIRRVFAIDDVRIARDRFGHGPGLAHTDPKALQLPHEKRGLIVERRDHRYGQAAQLLDDGPLIVRSAFGCGPVKFGLVRRIAHGFTPCQPSRDRIR